MKKIGLLLVCALLLCGCTRYERIDDLETSPAPILVRRNADEGVMETVTSEEVSTEEMAIGKSPSLRSAESIEAEAEPQQSELQMPERIPVTVKGIYVSAYVAGTQDMMDRIIEEIDESEVNAVVIDVKDDNGRITFAMDSPMVSEIGAVQVLISDMESLMVKLKEHNIYTIARVVAFRDPYLPEQKSELGLKLADGSTYRDNKGLAWVNPYKQESWDYLIEIGIEAHKAGFDEVQFDYIRFSTEKGMNQVVYEEEDTQGRNKTEIITEFAEYACEQLTKEGVFVSADVFGAIIGGGEDSDSVGQAYGEMSKHLDYICPMIYPSHYGDGNFGIEHPDTQPYDTILGALTDSREDLQQYEIQEEHQAIVRPWLQDFTASYLKHYIPYGDEEVRAQIQAVYDAGYEEWILWNASCKYHWDALKITEEIE